MLEIFQYWQVNLIMAVVFNVAFNQFYRLTAKKSKDTSSMFIIIFIIMSLVFLIFIPFSEIKFPADWYIYFLLVLSIVFYTINDRIKAVVYKYLDVSLVSILTQLSKIILVVYGIIWLKEQLTINNLVGIILIVTAGVLVTINKNTLKINRYVGLMIVAAFAFATALLIYKPPA